MTTEKKLNEILEEGYTKVFKLATPSANYEDIKKKYANKNNWFLKYYIPEDLMNETLSKILKSHKNLSKYEKRKLLTSWYLGHTPTNTKEVWMKNKDK